MNSLKIYLLIVAALCTLLASISAEAEDLCYAYDGLGRLIAVMDERGQAARYEYDAVGNMLAIRRESAAGPMGILLIDPPGATPGAQVDIFGIGFSQIAADNQVTVNGIGATVLGASRCGVTIEVPSGATSGPIVVRTPFGSATANLSVFDIVVPVTATALVKGASQQFTATITGCSDPRVVWSVNGIVGGNARVGTITSAGLYNAPTTIATPAVVTIQASSVSCPGLFAETSITIVGEPSGLAVAAVSVQVPVLPGAANAAAVSVAFGTPPTTSALALAVSVANAPVIRTLTPKSAPAGTTVSVTVTGANLSGATDLVFFASGGPDSQMSVRTLTVSPTGDALTADVAIAVSASVGPHVVVVVTPFGNSTGADTESNAFTVTAP